MTITLNGTTGITTDTGYSGDGVTFADGTPSNTLVTTTGGNVGVGTSSPTGRFSVTSAASQEYGAFDAPTSGYAFLRLRYNGTGYGNIGQGNAVVTGGAATDMGINATTNMLFATNGTTERMRIDSSGNVGIGVTTVNGKLDVADAFKVQSNGDVYGATGNAGAIMICGGGAYNAGGAIKLFGSSAGDIISFHTGSFTERMRIYANGNVGINNNLDFVGGAATVRIHLAGGTPSNSNTGVAAAWNVHSDYRLKENITPLTESLHKVSLLKPVTFSWKAEENGEITAGFLAHELAEQAPYAVFGEKDAVNEDGSIKAQAADYSKVVPLLVAAIQEQQAIITDLKARIETLENK